MVPTVAYGGTTQTVSLAVKQDALRKVLLSERGRNTLIQLDIDGGESFTVMVKDVALHPVSRSPLHADFVRVDPDKPLVVEIPFRPLGRSKGETSGGTLLVAVRYLEVRCLPSQIPGHVDYDVSNMEINDVVRVRDLKLPEGVEVLFAEDRKVLSVAPPRAEAEEAKPEGAEGEAKPEGAEGEAKAEGDDKDDKKKDKDDKKKDKD
jgi:large subunit ribosomal protein L25